MGVCDRECERERELEKKIVRMWNCFYFFIEMHTFSRSARSIFDPVLNSLRSRSTLLNDDEYLGKVGGGMGRAAIAGFSCDLLTLWMPAVGVVVVLLKFAMYAPGEDNMGLVGGTGGGPPGWPVGVDACCCCCCDWVCTGALIILNWYHLNESFVAFLKNLLVSTFNSIQFFCFRFFPQCLSRLISLLCFGFFFRFVYT